MGLMSGDAPTPTLSLPGGRLTERVAGELARWPGVRVCQAACGGGQALAVGHVQVVHLLAEHEAEVRLGAMAAARLGQALNDSGQVIDSPAAPRPAPLDGWIRLRLDGNSDVHLVLALASVAIAAADEPDRELFCDCPRSTRLRQVFLPRRS